MPIRQRARFEAANQTALEIQKETQQLDQEISDIMDNQQSINVELDTSEQLERDLNKQIEEGQTKLDDLKHQEILQQQASENAHLSCAATEQKVLFVMENAERIQEEMQKFREELKGLEASKGGTSRRNRGKRISDSGTAPDDWRFPENYLWKFRMRLKRRRRHVKI